MLSQMEARQPLMLADDLCEYSRCLLQKQSATDENDNPSTPSNNNESVSEISAAGGLKSNPQGDSSQKQRMTAKQRERNRKISLKAQQRQLVKKYSKVKQMTIDYYCREDLTVTTLKEFFEIFISSLKKEQAFHQELTSALYSSVGISMKFDQQNTQATLTIFLGGLA